MTGPGTANSEVSLNMADVFGDEFMEKVFPNKDGSRQHSNKADLPEWLSNPPNLDTNPLKLNTEDSTVPEFIEVDDEPEFPGAPYKDQMWGGILIPELPSLTAIINNTKTTEDAKRQAEWKIAKLYVEAEKKNSWYDGPLNERKKVKIKNPAYKEPSTDPQEQDSNDPGKAIVLYKEQKKDNGNQKDYDTDKPESTPTTNPEPKQTDEKKSWLKKLEDKFANTWLGRKNKDFIEYVNRHKNESKLLAVIGGFAGGTSAGLGLLAAEWAVSMAYPPLGIAVTGAAVGLAFNYAFTNIFNEVYNKPKAADELAAYKPEKHGDQKEYQEKVELDRKGRMKAFVIADIVGKVAGGIGIGLGLHHAATASNETAPIQRGNGALGADKLGNIHDHLATHPVPGEAPLPPHPDLIPSNYGDMSESQLLEHFRHYLGENNWQNPGPYKDYAGRPVELADVLVRTIVANQDGLSGAEIDAIRQVASTHNLADLIKTINQGAYRTIFG